MSALHNDGKERFARSLLRFVGVDGDLNRQADSLPHGEKRLVEIARALALRPKVLLLDEPAAGLSKSDKQRLSVLLRRIAELGIAVIIVEHDMPMIMSLSDLIVVLDGGKRIAMGDATAIRNDPLVRKAYLGDAPSGEGGARRARRKQGTALEVKRARFVLRPVAGACRHRPHGRAGRGGCRARRQRRGEDHPDALDCRSRTAALDG